MKVFPLSLTYCKAYYIVLVALLTMMNLTAGYGQQLKLDTLVFNGPIDKRINLVFLGDGYTQSQMDIFIQDAEKMIDAIFETTPFKEYESYFNAFAIKTPSESSGIRNVSGDPQRTYFGCLQHKESTGGLIGCDSLLKMRFILQQVPGFTQGITMAYGKNASGGIGGEPIVLAASMPEIATHEIGHTFGELADEVPRNPDPFNYLESPNLTANKNPKTVKWKNWIGIENVGLFPMNDQIPNYKWLVPTQKCQMANVFLSDQLFCAVCREAIVDKIHKVSRVVDGYEHKSDLDSLSFSLDILAPQPNTVSIKWKYNGQPLLFSNLKDVKISKSFIEQGLQTLTAVACDTTLYYRRDSTRYNNIVTWKINHTDELYEISVTESLEIKLPTPVKPVVSGVENIYGQKPYLQIFPNPVKDGELNVEINEVHVQNFSVTIINSLGQAMMYWPLAKRQNDKMVFSINTSAYKEGLYFLRLSCDKYQLHQNFIVTR